MFTDQAGNQWNPEVTIPVIREFCRKHDITLAQMVELKIGMDALFDLAWLSCRKQANERGITEDTFFETVKPDVLMQSVVDSFKKAFPASEKSEANTGPFDHGPSAMYSSYADMLGSVQTKTLPSEKSGT